MESDKIVSLSAVRDRLNSKHAPAPKQRKLMLTISIWHTPDAEDPLDVTVHAIDGDAQTVGLQAIFESQDPTKAKMLRLADGLGAIAGQIRRAWTERKKFQTPG